MDHFNTVIAIDKDTGVSSTVELSGVESPVNTVFEISIDMDELAAVENRDGDLVVSLTDGTDIQINDFFLAPEDVRNELVIKDSEGVVWWGQYQSALDEFVFAEIELSTSAALAGAAGSWWLLASVLGGAALLVAASGGGSGGSDDTSSDGENAGSVDTTAPDAPGAEFNTTGDTITGHAEPGSTVTLYDDEGNVLGETTADEDTGDYTLTLDEPLNDGEEIEVTATDEAGNESAPTQVTAPDLTSPAAPSFTVNDDVDPVTGN